MPELLRTKMYLRYCSLAAIILLMTNCANMNEADCLTADWQLIGFEDGSLGKHESNIADHRKECSQYGVTPDLEAYRQGHYQGSQIFCTPSNGFSRGISGKKYQRNCPTQLEAAFLAGFTDGQTVYGLKQTFNYHSQALTQANADIKTLTLTIAEKSELMVTDGLNREQRIAIRDEVAVHQQQLQDLQDALPLLKQESENAQQMYEQEMQKFSNYQLSQ